MIIKNGNKVDFKNSFEEQYISLRKKEGRLFEDEDVALLPHVAELHNLKKEWEIRKASCAQLIKYLSKKEKPLTILEVGCGNGWLSNQLSRIPNAAVTGSDINGFELQQAKRVFGRESNLQFVHGDLRKGILHKQKFDIIVFAASIQYFFPLQEIMKAAFKLLKIDGEVHILDSNFYTDAEVNEARTRSSEYFSQLGFGGMKDFYFHHTLFDLANYTHNILYNPNRIMNKLFKKKNPFYWIRIQHP
jgi:ubiquinone/menaquinone biosynthesis C-methylase UbiE